MSTFSTHLPGRHTPVSAENTTTRTETAKTPLTMRQAQLRMVPLSILIVFSLTAIATYVASGEVGEAIGVGAFMAFWIGGGFGAISAGALWNHHNEASLYKS